MRRACSLARMLAAAMAALASIAAAPIATRAVAATSAATAGAPGHGELPAAELFFQPPAFHSPRLSPSGKHIAAIYNDPKDGSQLVVVRELHGKSLTPIARYADPDFRFHRLEWANEDRLLLSAERRFLLSVGTRARATNLFGIDRDGKHTKYFAAKWPNAEFIQYQDLIIHPLPDQPDHVLLMLGKPGDPGPGVFRMNVGSGVLRRIVAGQPHILEWIADASGAVRLGVGLDPPNQLIVARAGRKGPFEKIAEFHVTQEAGFGVLGFTRDPSIVLVAARAPREGDPAGDRFAVYEYSLEQKALGRPVVGHDLVDVTGPIVYKPGTNEPVAIEYWVDQRELHHLDPEAEALQRGIDKALPGRSNEIIGNARDGQILLVDSRGPSTPPETYVILREKGEAFRLLAEYPQLEGIALGTPRPIQYRARDGLLIHGYLTLPPGSAGKNLPAILMPHGGPMARDQLRFDPQLLFLASRGYAVLQMNFRGSSGYGFAFESAGYQRWGKEMQDDISDGAAWLVEQGIADPQRIGIFGASYGGYAALMAAVTAPELFRCAASYAGVFDLIAENKHDKRYAGGEIVEEFRGDDREELKAASPIHHAERIQIPILLGHGTDDPNVHMNQSKKMAKALRRADKDVELVLYEDEIHGYAHSQTALDFAKRLEAFFARHLGPGGAAAER